MSKIFLFCACAALLAGCSCKPAEDQTQPTENKPVVYITRDISPESLVRIYEALGRTAEGKVAVKISTGEAGGHNYLKPALIERINSRHGIHILEQAAKIGLGSREYQLVSIDASTRPE